MTVNTSPVIESFKDSLLGASILSSIVGLHQLFYNQKISEIMLSSGGQFGLTTINGFVNLRLYNLSKVFLSQKGYSKKVSEILSSSVCGGETLAVVYFIHEVLLGSENSYQIALFMGFLTGVALPFYEKVFLERRR